MGYAIEALTQHKHELEPVILYNFHQSVGILDSITFKEERYGGHLIAGEVISDRAKARIRSSFQVPNSPDPGFHKIIKSVCVGVQRDVPGSRMLAHKDSWHPLDWLYSLGSLDSSTDRRELLVEVVVAVDEVDCSTVNTPDSSKEMAVVVVVVEGVVVETGSDSKCVDWKLVQTR